MDELSGFRKMMREAVPYVGEVTICDDNIEALAEGLARTASAAFGTEMSVWPYYEKLKKLANARADEQGSRRPISRRKWRVWAVNKQEKQHGEG